MPFYLIGSNKFWCAMLRQKTELLGVYKMMMVLLLLFFSCVFVHNVHFTTSCPMLLNINVILTRSNTWSYAMDCIFNDFDQLLLVTLLPIPWYSSFYVKTYTRIATERGRLTEKTRKRTGYGKSGTSFKQILYYN